MKKVILLILIFCISALTHAQIDRYVYSTKEEVLEILTSICKNPNFLNNINAQTGNGSCHNYPDHGFTILGKISTDFIKGSFTGESVKEGLLVTTSPESDYYPRFVLVQKQQLGWQPLIPNRPIERQDFSYGVNFTLAKGVETDVLVTLDGGLQYNDYGGALSINTIDYNAGNIKVESLFDMKNPVLTWQFCHNYSLFNQDKKNPVNILSGSPFASIQNTRQKDIDGNGFKDLILDVSVRYWEEKPIYTDYDVLDCDATYFSLPVENYEVIFTFDGYTFTPYKNVEWLQHIYASEK